MRVISCPPPPGWERGSLFPMAMPERYVFVCLNQAPCGGEVDGSGASTAAAPTTG